MRRSLAWLVAVPLMLAGSQAAHVLAYRWAYPGVPVRTRELLVTGHGYLHWLPLVLGLGGAVAALSLLFTAAEAARGRADRGLPAWAFALLPALAFVLQEHLELWLHTGVFPWHAAAAPTFLPGLALQLPFGLAAYAVARVLLRSAVRVGLALAATPLRPRRLPDLRLRPARPHSTGRRLRPLASRLATRGPPVAAPV